jgi:kinesin family protein 4/21/27
VQKSVQERRLQQHGTAAKVQLWIDQELEVLLSTIDAERTLEQLLEDRAMLHEQLDQLKVKLLYNIHPSFMQPHVSTRLCLVKQ